MNTALKLNRYNFVFDNNGQTIFYNISNNQLLFLTPELEELILRHQDNLIQLEEIHPELYNELRNREFIVDSNVDEVQTVIDHWNAKETDDTHLTITILPTLNCNLRCWYCYEKHQPGTVMKEDVREKVFKLMERAVSNNRLKNLNLDFFGGEPLLGFRNIVLPILKRANELCSLHHVDLTAYFTTNGVLLNETVVEALRGIDFATPPTFQITLDGNREQHDKTRGTADGKPTYETIIANIHKVLRAGMFVNARLNYTKDNADTLTDIIQEFESLPEEIKKNIRFDFQQVWQDMSHTDARNRAREAMEYYKKKNLCVSIERNYNADRCYADYENKLVVNYNGDLFKCTARDFDHELREGDLDENGVSHWNERYRRRMQLKNGNATCRTCSIFPICHGGCSQKMMETALTDGCPLSKNEKDKNEMLVGRLKFLMEHISRN